MPSQGWTQALMVMPADGTAVANTVTPTSILNAAGKVPLPPYFFDRIGKGVRITAQGRISNIVTTPGTLTLDIRMGPTSNIIVATSQAMQLNAVAKTNISWWLEWTLTCRSIGNGVLATLMHQGMWQSESVVGSPVPSAGGVGCFNIPASAPAVGTGFDSTVSMIVDVFATFSIANAGNSIQCHQFKMIDDN
jgi:hypothetical protein